MAKNQQGAAGARAFMFLTSHPNRSAFVFVLLIKRHISHHVPT